jgi:hypothetical protein
MRPNGPPGASSQGPGWKERRRKVCRQLTNRPPTRRTAEVTGSTVPDAGSITGWLATGCPAGYPQSRGPGRSGVLRRPDAGSRPSLPPSDLGHPGPLSVTADRRAVRCPRRGGGPGCHHRLAWGRAGCHARAIHGDLCGTGDDVPAPGRVSALIVIGGTCITADPGWSMTD